MNWLPEGLELGISWLPEGFERLSPVAALPARLPIPVVVVPGLIPVVFVAGPIDVDPLPAA